MKSRTRYTLIGIFIFVFIVLAPLLILYVSGTSFNFDSRDTNQTGIFDAKTNPSDAELYIDDEKHSNTPAIARFLKQDEYVFTLRKEGYYDWSKRLPIESGQVTYAQVGVDEIQLIKKSEPVTLVQGGVKDFILANDNLWYSTAEGIVRAELGNPNNKTIIPLKSVRIETLMRDKKHIVVEYGEGGNRRTAIINLETNRVETLPLSAPFAYLMPMEMASDDTVLSIAENKVFIYNFNTKQINQLAGEFEAYTSLGNTGYFLGKDGKISSVIWANGNYQDEQLILANAFTNGQNKKLIITDRKELFLLADKLYRVNSGLEVISDFATTAHLDLQTNELVFKTPSDIGFYNFLTSKPQLLTRSNLETNQLIIRSSLGYGFFATQTGLEAIEIDTRDKQNRYQLISGKIVDDFALTNNQKTIIALVDGSLLSLEIRN